MLNLGIFYAIFVQFGPKLVLVTIAIGIEIKISKMNICILFFFFFSFFQQYCPFSEIQVDLLIFM